MKKLASAIALVVFMAGAIVVDLVSAADKKPNIVVIWGDDIGGFNISAYNQGMILETAVDAHI